MSETKKVLKSIYKSLEHLKKRITNKPEEIANDLNKHESEKVKLKANHDHHHSHNEKEQSILIVEPFVAESLTVKPINELVHDEPTPAQIAAIFDIKETTPIEIPATLSVVTSPAKSIEIEKTADRVAEPIAMEQLEITDKMSTEDKIQEDETSPEKAQRKQQLTKFYGMLEELRKKRADFEQRYPKDNPHDKSKPYCAINELITTLYSHAKSYEKLKTNLSEFKESSSKLINDTRKGVLGQHRGCKEILTNLLLFIGTLGIGYLLAAAITRSLNPIKVNTNSVEKINVAAETINALTM